MFNFRFLALRRGQFPSVQIAAAVLASLPLLATSQALSSDQNLNAPTAPTIVGKVAGFGSLSRDDVLDGAFTFYSLKPAQLLSFQLQNMLGPSETMKAGPKEMDVPGNLFFPKQKEKYSWITITIQKPSFSLPQPAAGSLQEVFSLWFRSPFERMAKLGRSEAPYPQMLPLVRMSGYAFHPEADFSQSRQGPTMQLRKDYRGNLNFAWTRPQRKASQAEVAVAFQETPTGRWVMTDFLAPKVADVNGSLRFAAAPLGSKAKTMFIRINNDRDNLPESFTALVRDFDLDSGSSAPIALGELPAGFTRAPTLSGSSTVQWEPIAQEGWLAILRGKPLAKKKIYSDQDGLSAIADFGISSLMSFASPLEAWVDPAAGSFELARPLKADEEITLLFVGSTAAVPAPLPEEERPALFDAVNEIWMKRLK